jgi:regulatory protein
VAIITALQLQARNPRRVSVFLDGEFAFGLSAEVAATQGLRIGQTLSGEEIAWLRGHEEVERARNTALTLLSYRPRSRREIELRLARTGADSETIEAALRRLETAGLLDDRKFARFWVDNRQQFRPRGTRALRSELRQKGISSDVVDEALEGIGDEEENAYLAGRVKAVAWESVDDREFFRKMVSFLARRGFPYGACAGAARRMLAERGGEAP